MVVDLDVGAGEVLPQWHESEAAIAVGVQVDESETLGGAFLAGGARQIEDMIGAFGRVMNDDASVSDMLPGAGAVDVREDEHTFQSVGSRQIDRETFAAAGSAVTVQLDERRFAEISEQVAEGLNGTLSVSRLGEAIVGQLVHGRQVDIVGRGPGGINSDQPAVGFFE